VGEHLRAQVVDQPLTDARGEPPGHHGQAGADERGERHQTGQLEDERGVALHDPVVDDVLHQQRRDDDQARVDHRQGEEDRDQPAVGTGESEHTADGARVQAGGDVLAIGADVPPHLPHPAHA